jgi:hypothetical protein
MTHIIIQNLLMEISQAPGVPVYFYGVYAVGFLAAVAIGSIAWYNSKRPPGWEDKDRPNIVPEVKEPKE